MKSKDVKATPGDIPPLSFSDMDDASKDLHRKTTDGGKNVTPDQVPRTDGPGGE